MKNKPSKILIAPLDWGLGHATRCIPLIRAYLNAGIKVDIAGNGRSLLLLKKEFPELRFHDLPGYNVRYFSNNMFINILFQGPKIVIAAFKEYFALQEIVKNEQFDLIISDNRFGCFSKRVESVFITHQVNIQTPLGFLSQLVNFFNRIVINRFDECWIPDTPENALGGNLSKAVKLKKFRFIGLLSRFNKLDVPLKWEVVVVLSGPEPQRTHLEKIIAKQAIDLDISTIIIQGKPESNTHKSLSEKVKIIGHATSHELNKTMAAAKLIICRSGYSSLMDLAKIKKNAILIPTPGQTEQEYLAQHLMDSHIFYFQNQDEFDLETALEASHHFRGFSSKEDLDFFRIL